MDMPEPRAGLAPVVARAINVAKALIFLIIGWSIAGWLSALVRRRAEASKRIDQTLGIFVASIVRYALLAAVGIAGAVPPACGRPSSGRSRR